MPSVNRINTYVLIVLFNYKSILGFSFNQPKLHPNASWNTTGHTFANISVVGEKVLEVFIDKNDTVYVAARNLNKVQVWFNNDIQPTITLSNHLSSPYSLFVTDAGDIYIDNGRNYGRVEKWTLKSKKGVSAMEVTHNCYDLFVDTDNNLYCSLVDLHKVVKNARKGYVVVAGDGTQGGTSERLSYPLGIFVTLNFDLYVADCSNNRIQRFSSGNLIGDTVVGDSKDDPFKFDCPNGITFDADKNLFIADQNNNRIIKFGVSGFQCLLGCSELPGGASNELSYPSALSFDSYGNIFIADQGNSRIQKFVLLPDPSVTTTTTTTSTTTSTVTTITTVAVSKKATTTTTLQPALSQFNKSETTTRPIITTSTMTTINNQTTANRATTTVINSTIRNTNTSTDPTTSSSFSQEMSTVNQQSSSSSSISNQSCYIPITTLIPRKSSLSAPIVFKRSEDIYISSDIQFHCIDSLVLITQWYIHNCTQLSCSFSAILIDPSIETTFRELYIPSRLLPCGIYRFQLTVATVTASSSTSVYVKIVPSNLVAVNLIQWGSSMITYGNERDLVLNPGRFSLDFDERIFSARNWNYTYFCRVYDLDNATNNHGLLLEFDSAESSCLSNRSAWQWNGTDSSPTSSLIIFANTLLSNQIYQFLVQMKNPLVEVYGYLLVRVQDSSSPIIAIVCVISTMCIPHLEFQSINPTTQISLLSTCLGSCPSIQMIQWNIYQGVMNTDLNVTVWTAINPDDSLSLFGRNTKKLTVGKEIYIDYPHIHYWKFEVVYQFASQTSVGAIHFRVNPSPSGGNCSIDPHRGTLQIFYTVSCVNWFDQDGIKDYSIYVWREEFSKRLIIGFSSESKFQVQLPAGHEKTSFLNITIQIRDIWNSFTELNISSVWIASHSIEMTHFTDSQNNSFNKLLATGNQNTIAEIIILFTHQFNQMDIQKIKDAITNGASPTSMFVSPLAIQALPKSSKKSNSSATIEYKKQLNMFARNREYLIKRFSNLIIAGIHSIALQATALVQLTQSTNQLTRTTVTIACRRCHQLAEALHFISTRTSYEDVRTTAILLAQCAANVLNGINAPLQQRTMLTEGDDHVRQSQIATNISSETSDIYSILTSALKVHMNIKQLMLMNTSEIFLSTEILSVESLWNKSVRLTENIQVRFPSSLHLNRENNSIISLRSSIQPLAVFGNEQSNTDLSRSLTLSISDENDSELAVQTSARHSIEMMIPRDPNLVLPEMFLQDVISSNRSFDLKLINITQIQSNRNLTVSIHFQIRPLNTTLAYLFSYDFNQWTDPITQTDKWVLFCPANLTEEHLYTYYIDNQRTSRHQSVIFSLRELSELDVQVYCSNTSTIDHLILNSKTTFTANYELLIYTSGCYYLDKNGYWQSDGVLVGPLTSPYQTQCFTTHLER